MIHCFHSLVILPLTLPPRSLFFTIHSILVEKQARMRHVEKGERCRYAKTDLAIRTPYAMPLFIVCRHFVLYYCFHHALLVFHYCHRHFVIFHTFAQSYFLHYLAPLLSHCFRPSIDTGSTRRIRIISFIVLLFFLSHIAVSSFHTRPVAERQSREDCRIAHINDEGERIQN